MLKGKLLSRCYFSTFEEKSSYKIYSLDKNGKYLLEARNIDSDWKTTDNTKTTGSIKRRLAANQMIIAHILKNDTYIEDNEKYEIISKQYNRKLITKGIIKFENKTTKEEMILLIEPVRREESEEDDIVIRFKIYEEYFKSSTKADNVIVVCEDKKHMAEVYKEILLNKIDIPNIYFTYDLIQLDEEVTKSLFKFIINKNELEIENVELKIWKK